ncbi:MAG: hypothetical protein ISQ34_03450, partial [Rickettsiales bacterium]|nr:hypothetical protein [Rickettsiales bacterium]
KGILKDLKFVKDQYSAKGTRIFKSSTTSIINNILSDKVARSLEFVDDINFTSQVAFKTGTSTDFRDAWIVGYNSNYLVGIWLGNLDNSEMDGVTGSIGALPILQEILTLLYKKSPTSKLYMDDSLIKKEICVKNGVVKKALNCSSYTEFFATEVSFDSEDVARTKKPEIIFPTQNLVIAIDPKTPRNEQKLKIGISDLIKGDKIKIFVDGNALENKNYLYPLEEGTHIINATIDRGDSSYELKPVLFRVLD